MVALSLIASLLLAFPVQTAPQAWLGVALSGDNNPGESGVEIAEVFEGSPADAAGMRAGDRLMSIDERPLSSYEELVELLSRDRPGARRHFWVRRDLRVRLDANQAEGQRQLLGVVLTRGRYEGMLTVREVVDGSPAARAGLRSGDQLRTIDGQGTPTVELLKHHMSSRDSGGTLSAGISRRLEVELGAAHQGQRQRQREFFGDAPQRRPEHGQDRERVERRLQEIEAARERGRRGEHRLEERAPQGEHAHGHEPRHEQGREPRQEPRQEHGDSRDFRFEAHREPPQVGRQGGQALEAEMEELSEGLRALRRELAELRRELRALHERR